MKADIELVEDVKKGRVEAYSELVKRHQKGLLGMSLRFTRHKELAEDVVQEAFMKAFKNINGFEGRSSFKSWLYQIAINTAKNKLRKHKKEIESIDRVSVSQSAEAENDLVKESIKQELIQKIEELPEKQKMALKLRVFEDLSFDEISVIMDCPYNTAKANYRHGLMKMRSYFENTQLFQSWKSMSDSEGIEVKRVYVEVEQ